MKKFFKQKGEKDSQFYATISEGLKSMYKSNLLPLENEYEFPGFVSPALGDADFDSKPMVLMLGQYSTGKTTFIRYLLEQDYPGKNADLINIMKVKNRTLMITIFFFSSFLYLNISL